ncbi:Nuclear valosin-containing protein-like [Aphelenchoides besseyi]|nr:Nuclear valosin-containing protein-like [Aphelenchoides besseyi]
MHKKHLKAKHPDLYSVLCELDSQKPIGGRKRSRMYDQSESPTNEHQLTDYPQVDSQLAEQLIQSLLHSYNGKVDGSTSINSAKCEDEEEEMESAKFGDTNYGNNTILSLYNQTRPTPPAALAAIQPTVSHTPSLPVGTDAKEPDSPIMLSPTEQVQPLSAHSNRIKKRPIRKLNNASNGATSSIAQSTQFKAHIPSLRFADIGGVFSQFVEALELAGHLKLPEIHEQLNFQPPSGFLIHGPAGCGKTRFVEALAGELELPLMRVSTTELIAGVSGETEEKIRQLFQQALDVIASNRDNAQREMERRIVTQLIASFDELAQPIVESSQSVQQLVKFDADGELTIAQPQSVQTGSGVLVIGTTSRVENLDMGLRCAGRFEEEIALSIPDEAAREEILEVVCKKMKMSPDVSLKSLARLTPGYVGADLRALARKASMSAVKRVFKTIIHHDIKHPRCQLSIEEKREKVESMSSRLKVGKLPESSKLDSLCVNFFDFEQALSVVQPSTKRQGFATIPDVSWNDIGALKSVREELEWSILNLIKKPEDFEVFGSSTRPQGLLLCGPPGCGKTLLAKAIANEAGMNFISVKGPELFNMYVGESERAVRTVFQRARDASPCVIFFDEIDSLCRNRSNNESSSSDKVVNTLLTEMDGYEGRKQVFLIGATNRPDILDPAILRPGRLDQIVFNKKDPRISDDVQFAEVAKWPALENYTGADLTALVHKARVLAVRERRNGNKELTAITLNHFELASREVRPSVSAEDRERYEKLRTFTLSLRMSDHEDHDFATVDSGASATYPKQCSAIRKNEYVMIKGRPCKVVEMSTSKTGKHGHAKVHMVAIDIFTNKKLEDICPSTHNMDVPVVKKKEYQLLSIGDDGFLSLMDLETCDTKDDLRLPEGEVGDQIKQAFEKDETGILVAVTAACGEEQILGWKAMANKD